MSLSAISLSQAERAAFLAAFESLGDKPDGRAHYTTPGALAATIDPTTVATPALDMLDAALVDIADGRRNRLIWSLPPQEGKSQRVSRFFPLWMLLRNPELRIVIASYELGVARRWGRAIRNDIADHPELGLKVRDDTSAAHEWQLAGHRGGVYSVGIGGGLTGRPADCVSGETPIITPDGVMPVADFVQLQQLPLVLSWNHHAQRAEWRHVEATRVIPGRELVEIRTATGRGVRCTPDHRVFTVERGYVAAADLRAGERLVAADSCASDVRWLRDRVHETTVHGGTGQAWHDDVLLSGVSVGRSVSDVNLRPMRQRVHQAQVRGGEGAAQGVHEDVLFKGLLLGGEVGSPRRCETLRHMRRPEVKSLRQVLLTCVPPASDQPDRRGELRTLRRGVRASELRTGEEAPQGLQRVLLEAVCGRRTSESVDGDLCALSDSDRALERAQVLLQRVQAGQWHHTTSASRSPMRGVWHQVPAIEQSTHVLLEGLRRQGAFGPDGGRRQLALPARDELRRLVPEDAAADLRAGWPDVCGLQAGAEADPVCPQGQAGAAQCTASAPHRRGPGEQSAGEPGAAVQDVSCSAPQVGYDTVSVVRHLRGVSDTVYDLQVEGNRNFFAGEVLVHNCLILDDPVKGRAEADSQTYRENTWEWWTETARTRLAPSAPVVLIMTRWSEDDLAGRLIQQGGWDNINVPAQCETDNDPLGRTHGEYLLSARGRTTDEWQQIRRDVGERGWTALYQGRPAPSEGGMLKRVWWQHDRVPVAYAKPDGTMWAHGMDAVIQSWDMTFKDTDASDYVVGQVWGRRGAEVHLLDQVRDRMDFPATCRAVQALSTRWPQATLKLIEDKANGPAVIAQLRKTVPGMVPVNPKDSKAARVAAVSPFAEAGNVFLPDPHSHPWVGGFVEEAAGFPNASHDDQVDAFTQAVSRLLLDNSSTGFLDALVNSQAS